MSAFTAIRAASVTLQELLKREITNSTDPQITGNAIHIDSPKFLRTNNKTGICIWLYRVEREPDTLNRPPERISPTQVRSRPMPLILHYLVCALHNDTKSEQALVGKTVQVLYDYSIVRGSDLKDDLAGEDTELRLVLEPLSIEEIARVWDAMNEPYQLSLSYVVQVIAIDSDRDVMLRPPVLASKLDAGLIVGTEGA